MRYVVRSIVQNRIINERELVVTDDTCEDEVVEQERTRVRQVYPEAECYIAQRIKE
ncbi:hypothetical protein [Effusibacillus consociatus]|uniref:Uncharacterized protein n=1 Tax=Effusibacillus consociatus TaxID=1117041 RepID=A0ABV9Q0U4_9BACL